MDTAAVTDAFQRLAATRHPDSPGGSAAAFAGLNAAWQTLRDPASCLRHFLELEHPAALASAERVPAELGDLFMEIAEARQSAQALAAKLAAATSPLGRAVIEGERLACVGKLNALAANIAARHDAALGALRAADASPAQLAALLGSLIFLGKWAVQLRESALALG